jgi:hypothetical protein
MNSSVGEGDTHLEVLPALGVTDCSAKQTSIHDMREVDVFVLLSSHTSYTE